MSKGSGGGTQVQRSEPSTLQAPYLADLYQQAQDLMVHFQLQKTKVGGKNYKDKQRLGNKLHYQVHYFLHFKAH